MKNSDATKQTTITRIEQGRRQELQDYIIREISLKVRINRKEPLLWPCSGRHVNELITGYLYTNRYIKGPGDIRSLHYHISEQVADVEIKKSTEMLEDPEGQKNLSLPADKILQWMKEFSGLSETFQKTGAVHIAAIAGINGIQKYFEDISRHNALDMIIGWSLMQNEPLHDKCLLLSCRISKSIIKKAHAGGFPIIVSTSAPTDQALDIARKNNIALAGFARGNRMNIYHREEGFRSND